MAAAGSYWLLFLATLGAPIPTSGPTPYVCPLLALTPWVYFSYSIGFCVKPATATSRPIS